MGKYLVGGSSQSMGSDWVLDPLVFVRVRVWSQLHCRPIIFSKYSRVWDEKIGVLAGPTVLGRGLDASQR